jgi:hypothetical protein
MGWKSTIEITREEAIRLIQKRMNEMILNSMTNRELEYIVEDIGYGDNPEWDYFGHNFFVVNELSEDK